MPRYRALSRVYGVLGGLKQSLTVAAGILTAAMKGDSEHAQAYLGQAGGGFVRFAQEWAWFAAPLLILIGTIIGWSRRLTGDPKIWKIVHDVLDDFREQVFQDIPDDQLHEHRVTLFKRVSWHWCLRRWPWSGWLIPVERSGHTTQRSTICFKAPDAASESEGIAGKAWVRRRPIYVPGLPDVSGSATTSQVREYAKQSLMSEAQVRIRKPQARSLYGVAVEVKGARWGVLVIDSRETRIDEVAVQTYYRMVARFLGKTLEGV